MEAVGATGYKETIKFLSVLPKFPNFLIIVSKNIYSLFSSFFE